MKRKSYRIRQALFALALGVSVAAVAVPAATAGGSSDAGLVPARLGSPDPHAFVQHQLYAPSIVDSRLGSQDPREAAQQVLMAPGLVASRLGSQDPRDTARAAGLSFTGH